MEFVPELVSGIKILQYLNIHLYPAVTLYVLYF